MLLFFFKNTELLQNCEVGTFLVRWSPNIKSYVLSYRTKDGYQHVAYIELDADGMSVKIRMTDGALRTYNNIGEYLSFVRSTKVIKDPYQENDGGYGYSRNVTRVDSRI